MSDSRPQASGTAPDAGVAHARAQWQAAWAELTRNWGAQPVQQALSALESLVEGTTGEASAAAADLNAFLAGLSDEPVPPDASQADRLRQLAQRLDAALADAEPAPPPLPANDEVVASIETARAMRLSYRRNLVCVLGLADTPPAGLVEALSERSLECQLFLAPEQLVALLQDVRPGALLLEAGALRHLPRIAEALGDAAFGQPDAPVLAVYTPRRDLTDRLLAMRAAAGAYFETPLDAYRIAARISELLGRERNTGFRVLLADADRIHAAQCAGWLAEQGMVARLAASGQAVLTALSEFRPDLLLASDRLPDVRGFELAQMIRQQPEWSRLPLVLISETLGEAERFDAIAAGADDVVQKPLKPRHLSAMVQSRIQHARQLGSDQHGLRDVYSGLIRRDRVLERLGEAPRPGTAVILAAWDQVERARARVGWRGLLQLQGEIAQAIRETCALSDWPCALTDFLYLVIIERDAREQVQELAEKLRIRIGRLRVDSGEESEPMSVSVAATLLDGSTRGPDELLSRLEGTIQAAQRVGGNRVLWSEASGAAQSSDPLLAVRAVLSRPWHEGNWHIEYRPLVPLGGRLSGQFDLEFWLTSTRAQGVRVPHAVYAPIAAELGVLDTLEQRRVVTALDARAEAVRGGRTIRVLLPVSASWLAQPNQVEWLLAELAARHLSGSGLGLEITSSEFLDRLAEIGPVLSRLREAGLRLGLSDYGRDWAAIHALKRQPLDYLRLYADLLEVAGGRATGDALQSVVRMAHQMHAAVIASDVETLENGHVLLRIGVDYGSGDGLAPAKLSPEFDFDRAIW